MATASRVKVFYCVSTHWDREWYEPFQEYRMWLVEVIDELLGILERNPEFRRFHLDGQAVVLADYLEVRPENRDRLHRLVANGRLQVGPWYVLPDEWLVSGEGLVRNLHAGIRTCQEFGVRPLSFGYTPDQFGHIAALPMIVSGFGLKGGIVWRGTTDEHYPPQFVWLGPDGSRMVTHKLFDEGAYGWHFYKARHINKLTSYSQPEFQESMDEYIRHEQGRIRIPALLILDGNDHQHAGEHMIELFQGMQAKYPDLDFTWGTLEEYAEEMGRHAEDLPERSGELRESCPSAERGCQYLIAHVVSSRYPIKQQNDQCQALLEKWSEPACLFQSLAGGQPILRYLDIAWEYLLKNHPHDSICGCSIDQVHRDMRYRFDQTRQIADGLIRRAIAPMGAAAEEDAVPTRLVVHNPLPHARKGVEVDVSFPAEWPKTYVDGFSGERINKFELAGKDGQPLAFQIEEIHRKQMHKRLRPNGRKHPVATDVYRLLVDAEVPPCGYTGLELRPSDAATRNHGSLMTGALSAANETLSVELRTDGTARLTHAASQRTFDGLFLYEDCGDAGDGWTFGPLVQDLVYRSPGSRVTTALESNGSLRCTFRVEREIELPRALTTGAWTRSDERRTVRIVDRISLERGKPYLRVRTRVENSCGDHRLRVLFPSNIACDTSFAETPFAVVERAVEAPPEAASSHERLSPEKAFTSFFGVKDGRGGLAVLAPAGLHEYEVTANPERALALTLFRAVGRTVMTAGEPDGQLIGDLDFEYLVYPFAGDFDAVEALRHVAEYQAPVQCHLTAELPEPRSFLRLEKGAAVVTAIKPAAPLGGTRVNGTGLHAGTIRLWNPSDKAVEDVLWVDAPVATAHYATLREDPEQPIALRNGGIPVTVPARGLATVTFTWE